MSTEEEAEILVVLRAMEEDTAYNTPARYSSNTALYPNNSITFSAQHLTYMRRFPDLDPRQYIQNLKLITRIR